VKRAFVPVACAALVVLVVAVYAPVRGFAFVSFDDPQYVAANPVVARGLTWDGVGWAFTTWTQSNWHPLTWLSHMLDVQLFGLDAGAHHVVNVVLHAANTLLLFGVLGRMTGAWVRSAFVAALFAVHPTHVESVAWIAERKDVLSTLFLLLALSSYVAYVRTPSRSRYALVVACFVAGLLAKPMLVTLPFLLLVLDFWPLRRATPWRALVVEKLPLFALSAASCVVTFLAQRAGGAVMSTERLSVGGRVANALVSYVAYVGKTLWPTDLAVLYPIDAASLTVVRALLAAALLAVVTVVAVREATRRPWLLVGWLWFLGLLVPVIGLVQVGNQSMADRYTYVPSIGLFIAIARTAGELAASRPPLRTVLAAAGAAAVVACAVAARRQVETWRDSFTLWDHAVAATDRNLLAQLNRGTLLLGAGRIDEAQAQFEECLRDHPRCVIAMNNLGHVAMQRGRVADAERLFAEATRLDPDYVEARVNLGRALRRDGRLEEAVVAFREALSRSPRHAKARAELVATLEELGRSDEAAAEANR